MSNYLQRNKKQEILKEIHETVSKLKTKYERLNALDNDTDCSASYDLHDELTSFQEYLEGLKQLTEKCHAKSAPFKVVNGEIRRTTKLENHLNGSGQPLFN